MYTPSRPPAWHRDVMWVAGLVLLLATAVTAAAFAWSRLAGPEAARPILHETLRATLLPGSDEAERALAVRAEPEFAPGEPFEALPGSGVRIDPTEVDAFAVDDAVGRIAGVWTGLLLDGGTAALLETVTDPALRAQAEAAATGPAARLLEAELAEELMAAGLDDGSRLANWPLQAQQDPTGPVQPIVGLLLFVPPSELQGLSDRQIGEAMVARLAELVRTEGADAGREAIANVNLSARFEQAMSQARTAVHELFAALVGGHRAELEARLADARAALAGVEEEPTGLAGVLPASELAGLPPAEANERILAALAERTWAEGPDAVEAALAGDARVARLGAVGPVLGAFTAAARATAARTAWIAALVALAAFLTVALLARGVGRLARPGVAIALGALPGALLAWGLAGPAGREGAALPAGARAEGVPAELVGLVRYLAAAVPEEAIAVTLRIHAVAGGIGLGLVLTAAILAAVVGLRPRRRSYL